MDAVGADQDVCSGLRTVGELDPYTVAILDRGHAFAAQVDRARRQCRQQHVLELRPM
jgi:hypothetical protein